MHTDGDLDGQVTYRLYLETENEQDYLSAITGVWQNPPMIQYKRWRAARFECLLWVLVQFWAIYSFLWQRQVGVNPAFFGLVPNLAYDSWVTIGAENSLETRR